MNRGEDARRVPLSHEACRELLPWYVSGTLDETERSDVADHVARCLRCRDEIATLEELQQTIRERPAPAGAVVEVVAPLPPPASRTPGSRSHRVWQWVVVGQAAAILLLGVALLWPSAGDAPFRLRSNDVSAPFTGPALRVVFAERAEEGDIRQLLHSLGVEIVAGPTPHAVYTLRPRRSADVDRCLEVLRESPVVRLAEPVAGASPH